MLSALRGTFSVSLAEDPLSRLKRLVKDADRFLPALSFPLPRLPAPVSTPSPTPFAADGGVSTSTSFRAASASGEMVVAGESGPENMTGTCGTSGLDGVGWRSSTGMGRGWVVEDGDGDGGGSMVDSKFLLISQDPEVFFHLSICGVFLNWHTNRRDM